MQPLQPGQLVWQPQPIIPRRRFGSRTIVAMVLWIVALIFVIISMLTAWWTMTITVPMTYPYPTSFSAPIDYSLDGECASIIGIPGSTFSGICMHYTSFEKPIGDVFGLASLMMTFGLILAILSLILLIVGVFRPRIGIGAVVCGLIGSVLVLVAPIYILATLPGAFNTVMGSLSLPGYTFDWSVSGFFGSGTMHISYGTTSLSAQTAYGGNTGWYFAIFSFVLLLLSTVATAIAVRALMSLGRCKIVLVPVHAYYQPSWPSYGLGQGQPSAPPLSQSPAQPAQPSPTPVDTVKPPTGQTEGGSPSELVRVKCSSCGAEMQPNQTLCPACGVKIS